MKFTIVIPILIACVAAIPTPAPPHVNADIDPQKAPGTAKNMKEHTAQHGKATLTTTAGELNTPAEAADRRKEAIDGKKVPGKTIDEEAPASFRKPGDPVTTKPTDKSEGYRKYS